MRLRCTKPALLDLEIIGDYIARINLDAASALVAKIFDRVDGLAAHPYIGRPGRVPGTRERVVVDTPFIVPYRVGKSEVALLAVFHGARRWPEAFS